MSTQLLLNTTVASLAEQQASGDDSDWLSSCSDGCGWVAALFGAVLYGSYGVPIKNTKHIPVHPLVLQTFKSVTMFVTCWLVMLLGIQPRWTPWGLLSGLLWVSGGTCGIYAIRMAGLAVAVGTWSSVMCCINFIWGILIFQEPISHFSTTMGSFLLLGLGLVGMSHFSSPEFSQKAPHNNHLLCVDKEKEDMAEEGDLMEMTTPLQPLNPKETSPSGITSRGDKQERLVETAGRDENDNSDDQTGGFLSETKDGRVVIFPCDKRGPNGGTCATTVTQRTAGILGAVLNGVLAGSSLIPVHYAKAQGLGGANYYISFACGSVIANTVVWALLIFVRYENSLAFTCHHLLPNRQHFRELLIPGLSAGFLLSVAMFFSILAVTYLGQGVGNSVVQSKILISGLWGILWFGEIRGCRTIVFWLLSALLSICGILLLSHERLMAAAIQVGGGDKHL